MSVLPTHAGPLACWVTDKVVRLASCCVSLPVRDIHKLKTCFPCMGCMSSATLTAGCGTAAMTGTPALARCPLVGSYAFYPRSLYHIRSASC